MRIPFPLGLEEDYTLSPKGAGYHFVPRTTRSIAYLLYNFLFVHYIID